MARLQNDNYEEIKNAVVDLFEKLQVREVPIDCFAIAQSLGFEVIPYSKLSAKKVEAIQSLGNGDAYTLIVEGGKKVIYFDNRVRVGRQRFTLMHEIGHYVLGHKEESELAKSEADFFARYSLAPLPLVHALKIDNFADIEVIFEVSGECAYNVMNHYNKWLHCGPKYYLDYEERLMTLFKMKRGA